MSVTDDVRGGAGRGGPWPPDGTGAPEGAARQDGPRHDGARQDGPRPGGPGRQQDGPRHDGPRHDGSGPAEGRFDKTPPQDIAAEQCVLGGMLLSKDAIADVVEILKANDFYRPIHAVVFDAILDLYGRGEPADAITVAAALADSGDLGRVGGAPYLHTLIASVPTAANAAYYARIVGERAVLRRLVEAGTKIVQLGYGSGAGGGRDVDDVVDLAQQAVYDVTERRVSEDFAVLADLLQPTLDEIEAVGAQGGMMTGVPTGFTDLDRLLNGLHAGQLIIVAGRPGLGKALALDTPLPTPDGWTTMGEVQVGDRLLGADGRPTTVTAAFEVRYGRPCYEVEFSDGTVIVADAEHLWQTSACPDGPVSTVGIAATLRTGTADRRLVHAVPASAPLRLPARELPVPPYLLGGWLGGERATPPAGLPPEVLARPDRIPEDYLRSSAAQRRELLAGLMDAGGSAAAAGDQQYVSTSKRLAEDVHELLLTLGHRGTIDEKPATEGGGTATNATEVNATGDGATEGSGDPRLAYTVGFADSGSAPRFIVDVRPVPSVPVRCVTVDSPDHLYLASRAMIPTHNSTASMDFARNAAIRANHASAIFSLEMSKVEIVMRLLSAEARVPLHVLRSGQLSDDDWTKLARCMGEISEAPLFVDDTPNMNLMEIRAKSRRLKQRHDLKLIVVDYLQLMSSPKRVESRQQEVAELSRGLKLLAKEVECPVIAVSQLNRGPEQRTDKRPQLSDLRESGCLTAATRVVRADTNTEVTLGDLLASGARDIPVWALDERLRYVPHTMTHVFPNGRRETFRMTLASGKTIDATANHPFLTVDGWRPVQRLRAGVRLATPRHVPPPLAPRRQPDAEVRRMALAASAGARVPAEAYALPKEQLTHFLRHLWARTGSVTAGDVGRRDGPRASPPGGTSPECGSVHLGSVHLSSPSRRLLEDVSRLLLRYGVTARLSRHEIDAHPVSYRLEIRGRDDQLRFLREVGVPGPQAVAGGRLRARLERVGGNPADTVPRRVWRRLREVLVEPAPPLLREEPAPALPREPALSAAALSTGARSAAPATPATPATGTPPGPDPGPARLGRIAAVLDEAELELHATNDVVWDEIVSIESSGEHEVYDATVPGAHNFIANGIATHNSIEQDADVVILLHRDDYYDKESPRAGEADFIIAKHRNGPTDTVTVAAQLHLSRFVDMAIV